MQNNSILNDPMDAIVFDCDGTLSHIEGIDELAKNKSVVEIVSKLTEEAMGKVGINPELYQKRLALVNPTREEVQQLGITYFQHRAPDSAEVITVLQALGKAIYVVSAGLKPAVARFGELLKIPERHIFAVNIYFDEAGNYHHFDGDSPLVQPDGKRIIVSTLQKKHKNLLYVGDGMNDYAVYDLVTRFIGYGGAFYREQFAKRSEFYITRPTFKALLP